METEEDHQNIQNNKNDKFVHYHKINIFGEPNVGKSSLISLMENYDSDIFQLNFISDEESFCTSSTLVEDIKEIKIRLNDDKNIYLNVYETNIDRFDSIKMNLDTLLLQTECIIIMWDNNSPTTFENIPGLILTIENCLKDNEFNVPIFVLQNKMDLQFDIDEISVAKDKFNESINKIKDNQNIIYKKITLKNNKDDFYKLIGDIEEKLSENISKIKNDIYKVKYCHPLMECHKTNEKYINCLLLGFQGTGKTSFLKSLIGENISNTLTTIGINISTFNSIINNQQIYFRIHDTAGQERFKSLPQKYYKGANSFLIFFDVTNEESFNSVKYWIESITENNGKINDEYELFLVANKIDETESRIIGKNKGKDLANKYQIKYFEISCLKKINIYELLYEISFFSYKKYKKNEKSNESFVLKHKKTVKKKKKFC